MATRNDQFENKPPINQGNKKDQLNPIYSIPQATEVPGADNKLPSPTLSPKQKPDIFGSAMSANMNLPGSIGVPNIPNNILGSPISPIPGQNNLGKIANPFNNQMGRSQQPSVGINPANTKLNPATAQQETNRGQKPSIDGLTKPTLRANQPESIGRKLAEGATPNPLPNRFSPFGSLPARNSTINNFNNPNTALRPKQNFPITKNLGSPSNPLSINRNGRENSNPAGNRGISGLLPFAGLAALPLIGRRFKRPKDNPNLSVDQKDQGKGAKNQEKKDQKKKRRKIIVIAGIIFLILSSVFSIVIFAGVYAMVISRIKETINPTNLIANLHCETWADAPDGYQASIESAADKVGVHPALLGAIFMSEHGDSLKASPGDDGIWAQGGAAQGPFQVENFSGKWTSSVYKKYSDRETGDPNNMEDSALVAAAFIRVTLEDNGLKAGGTDEVTVKAAGMLYNRGPGNLQKWKAMGFPLDNAPENTKNPGWIWGAPYPSPNGPGYALRTWKNFQGLNNGCVSLTSITTALMPGSLICKANLNLGYKKSSKCGWVELPELEQYYHKYAVGGTLNQWGQQSLINIIVSVSKAWTSSGRAKLYIGDISKECSTAHGSVSHADGLGADIQLPGHMMNLHENSGSVNKNYSAADKQLNIELAKAFIDCGVTLIYYDDPDVIAAVNTYAKINNKSAKMVAWPGHYAHMHISIGSY